MTPQEAARILGVHPDAPWDDVRRAYRERIRHHHPDLRADRDATRAVDIIRAFAVLETARTAPPSSSAAEPPPPPPEPVIRFDRGPVAVGRPPAVARIDADTLALDAPADETFRWFAEVVHDIGEVTYIDRSVPILEALCRFEGEPATSLVMTFQGRMDRTDVFCHVESIEARPAPPTAAVVDLLEDAFLVRSREP